MDINKFKNKCKETKEKQDAIEKRYEDLQKEQESYARGCYKPKWKFNWRKLETEPYCPNCGKKLSVYDLRYWRFGEDSILTCECGYEYAW